ncbi:zinc-finger homeodomain protein 8-like [Argentina anserina]|uniref:zinc-finger homeodomain protein 8-like n=1 Tax=Argentina anserina TaxID=57926 RepID=UPI00217645A2|nr:zinc-finger homeodomain protein 8-like [Potentilla anserina]
MTKTNRSHFFPEKFEFYNTLTFDSQFQTQVMDFKAMSTTTASATASINTPDTDTELIPTSDPKSGPFRSFSFNTGTLLKPHHHPFHLPPPQTTPVGYRECLKNHAASLGGHALDGCGEFYPSPISNPADPTSLKCAACGCHRNFHRRDWPDEPRAFTPPKAFLVSSTHHHHHRVLPPPPARHSMSPSPSRSTSPGPSTTLSPHSPPPVSHVPPSFFGTPTQILLALSSAAYTGPPSDEKLSNNPTGGKSTTGRKRSRTKFSQEQKDKMFSFAEKLGWRMQRSEDKFVEDFCHEIGIGRNVFKIWMHNNKHQRRQRLLSSAGLINDCDGNYGGDAVGGNSFDSNAEEDNNNNNNVNAITNSPNESSRDDHHHQRFYLSNNGSSSSS